MAGNANSVSQFVACVTQAVLETSVSEKKKGVGTKLPFLSMVFKLISPYPSSSDVRLSKSPR